MAAAGPPPATWTTTSRSETGALGPYLRPTSLDEALTALAERPLTILAGGTDFYPARVGRSLEAEAILDITAIPSLRGVEDRGDHWRIGGATTWSDILEADLPSLFNGLKRAAKEVGGVQIQNAGTLAGNLCNASPAADGIPVLLSLDAVAEVVSAAGTRRMPVGDLVLGNRRTALQQGEILAAFDLPKPAGDCRTGFMKLGARRYLVISIVAAALRIDVVEGRIALARVAIGACSAVARRLPDLEAALVGLKPADAVSSVEAGHFAALSPIDDIRGSAGYRLDTVVTLVRRGLAELAA